jgi:uncharacterized metal-binding protein
MACECSCGKNSVNKLVYSCAGAANTGYLSDQVARAFNSKGVASMTCLAAVGADLAGFIESAKSSDKNIVIDGCPVACGKKIFEARGLPFTHFVTTDFGVEKKKTEITPEVIERVTADICQKV